MLCVCESVERVNQFLKGVGKVWLKQFLIKIQQLNKNTMTQDNAVNDLIRNS